MLLDEEHYITVEDTDTDPQTPNNPVNGQEELNKSEFDDNIIFKTSHKVALLHAETSGITLRKLVKELPRGN